jgi:arabinose-5-phosphate isomerase
LERGDAFFDLKIQDMMNPNPMFVYEDQMAAEALDLLRSRRKPSAVLPVLDRTQKVVGMLHIMDLVSAGI